MCRLLDSASHATLRKTGPIPYAKFICKLAPMSQPIQGSAPIALSGAKCVVPWRVLKLRKLETSHGTLYACHINLSEPHVTVLPP